jgi:hypothetical protein
MQESVTLFEGLAGRNRLQATTAARHDAELQSARADAVEAVSEREATIAMQAEVAAVLRQRLDDEVAAHRETAQVQHAVEETLRQQIVATEAVRRGNASVNASAEKEKAVLAAEVTRAAAETATLEAQLAAQSADLNNVRVQLHAADAEVKKRNAFRIWPGRDMTMTCTAKEAALTGGAFLVSPNTKPRFRVLTETFLTLKLMQLSRLDFARDASQVTTSLVIITGTRTTIWSGVRLPVCSSDESK